MNDKEIEDLLYKEMPLICEKIIYNFPKDEDIHHEFSLEFETKMNNLIKENNRRLLKRKVKRCLKVASLFLVFLGFSIFIGFKSTDANLKNIITNIKKVFQTHTVFEFSNETENYNVDVQVPTYIPKGYKLIEQSGDKNNCDMRYENEDGNMIDYSCSVIHSTTVALDTEDAKIETVKIGNYDATFISKDDLLTLFYEKEDRLFIITMSYSKNNDTVNFAKDELIKILESVE